MLRLLLAALAVAAPGAAGAQVPRAPVRPAADSGQAAATVRVAPGGDLAGALTAVRPGDTLRVAGTHTGNFVVDRTLVLLAEPGAVLDGAERGTVVTITADSVELRGFAVRGSGRSLDDDLAAIRLVRCEGCRVIDNRIERSLHGIYLLESSGTLVAGNRIEGDTTLAEARRGNGIHLFHSERNRIERNAVRRTRDGIYFSFASRTAVRENRVSEVRYGLHYMYSDDNTFRGNVFTRNAAGAAIMFSQRILFEDNVFAEHVGYRAYGILLQTADRIEARRNRIEGNLVGVFFDNSTRSVFRANAVVGNGVGIDLLTSAELNTFTENVFVANRSAVRTAVGAGENVWAVAGRGNYWGDRAVFDLDGDGIGDRPYRPGDAFSSIAAVRPVLEVFSGTPAARALSWAEDAFPVFELPRVADPAPLVEPPADAPVPGPLSRAAPTVGPAFRGVGPLAKAGIGPLIVLIAALAMKAARRVRRRGRPTDRA